MNFLTFAELGLGPDLLAAIDQLGYEQPSSIQTMTIPPVLEGKDVVGLSETGSGKTAAFALPALQKIDLTLKAAQVLILCPARELAMQVCEEVHNLGKHMRGLRAVPVYGGAPMDRQIRALRDGAQVIVGTPGRLLDHLRRGTLKTDHVRMVVLDEADRMLDMGFRPDMEVLLGALPPNRQTLFFSATMNREVERLIKTFSKDPQTLSVRQKSVTVASVEQMYCEVRQRSKVEVLCRFLDLYSPRLAIVFCNTKRSVDECTESLIARGYVADRLHGDISQYHRERVIRRFREGKIELLVATDVAGRGLDVDEIDAVFNYELPHDPEDYVHRIGRTGRAGRSGMAISFLFGRDIYRLQSIERYTRQKIRRQPVPTVEEVEGRRANQFFDAVKERLETRDFKPHTDLIDRLLDQGHTPTDIAGCLMTMLMASSGRENEAITEDEPAAPARKSSKGGPRSGKKPYGKGGATDGGRRKPGGFDRYKKDFKKKKKTGKRRTP